MKLAIKVDPLSVVEEPGVAVVVVNNEPSSSSIAIASNLANSKRLGFGMKSPIRYLESFVTTKTLPRTFGGISLSCKKSAMLIVRETPRLM